MVCYKRWLSRAADHYNKRETRKLCRRQADSRTTKNWPIKPAHSFCINPPSFQSHKFFFLFFPMAIVAVCLVSRFWRRYVSSIGNIYNTYIPYFLKYCPPLNSVPIFEKAQYIKKEHHSNFCTFEIASLVNVPGHYLRKYGMLK